LYITDFGFESKITFGQYDGEVVEASTDEVPPYYQNVAGTDRLFWLETLGDTQWSLPLYKMVTPTDDAKALYAL